MRAVRRWWLVFGAGAAAFLAVLVWVSLLVLDLERAEHAARDHATHQERMRLALWRMDSWLAPRLAREAARPYFEYAAYYPQERAYDRMLRPLDASEVLAASPLLAFSSEVFPLHFQVSAEGLLTSPQSPLGKQLVLALNTCIGPDMAEHSGDLLDQLAARISYEVLLEATAPERTTRRAGGPGVDAVNADAGNAQTARADGPQRAEAPDAGRAQEGVASSGVQGSAAPEAQTDGGPYDDEPQTIMAPERAQQLLNQAEQTKRKQNLAWINSNSIDITQPDARDAVSGERDHSPVEVGSLVPVRLADGGLLYARRVSVDGSTLIQGLTVDWPVLRDKLLAEVTDLLPRAALQATAVGTGGDDPEGLELATAPALLTAPEPPSPGPEGMTPARWTLALGWLAALAAAGLAGHSVRATLELGERRSRFATAVTHELRTPLTTFRMYSEMLADGMVTDEAARAEYLRTLRDESERLSRLVENVLTYARLEEGRASPQAAPTSVERLLEGARPALERRLGEADMSLVIETGEAADVTLSCDATLVEQVLFNLVDNAAKYAAQAEDRRVHLTAARAGAALQLTLGDRGPGVPADARRAIFEPFERRAADAVPGVGLGLALCRGLARHLGGDLSLLDDGEPGARFRLVLPLPPAV